MNDRPTAGVKATNLQLIRLSLFLGPVMFAAISLYQRSAVERPAADPSEGQLGMLRYLTWALVLVAIIVANVLRGQVAGLTGEKLQSRLTMGWAVGEAAALAGIVHHYQGGALSTMVIGIVGFAVVLMLLRIPDPPRYLP